MTMNVTSIDIFDLCITENGAARIFVYMGYYKPSQ